MNTEISLIQTVQNMDAAGFATSDDVVLATVRAYREDRHGTKTWANRAAFSEATALFRFRALPGVSVSPTLYIACQGERFKIISAEDMRGRGMYIEVLAERIEPTKG
jgi:head-tail adaptor